MPHTQDIKSTLISRNITIQNRRTSVRLEPEMWSSLKDIAKREICTIHEICTIISMRKKTDTSLTAAIRVFVMLYFRASSTEEGHIKAGHGNIERMKTRAKINAKMSENGAGEPPLKNNQYIIPKIHPHQNHASV